MAIFGAILGSFYNVCIYRIPRGVPLSLPPSHCYQCGQPIRWFDNIPLLSYWILRGRCRNCGARFSMRYFFIELLTAALFVAVFLMHGRAGTDPKAPYSLAIIPGVIFVSLLIIPTFTDLDHWIIPDRISLGGTVAGIALAAIPAVGSAPHNPLSLKISFLPVPDAYIPLANSLLGAAFGFGMLWSVSFFGRLAFKKEAMGMGDVKLMAMFGAFAGPLNCILIFMLACLVGLVPGIVGMALAAVGGGAMDPAVAGLVPSAARCKGETSARGLDGAEWLAVTRALIQPGPVSSARHHLPFVPWLSIAALIVYLAWERLHRRFGLDILVQPW